MNATNAVMAKQEPNEILARGMDVRECLKLTRSIVLFEWYVDVREGTRESNCCCNTWKCDRQSYQSVYTIRFIKRPSVNQTYRKVLYGLHSRSL